MAQYTHHGSLNEIFSPAFFVAFGLTLVLNYLCSPILFKVFVPVLKREKLGSNKSFLYSLLASTVHAVESSILASYVLSTGELRESTIFSTSPLGKMAMHFTLGYCLADLFVCLLTYELRHMYSTVIHHLAIVSGITLGCYYNRFMYFIVYRLIAEYSTPWVNFRWIVYNLGDKKSKLYVIISLTMTFSFFLCRIIVIPWHSYMLYSALLSSDGQLVAMYLKVCMIFNFTLFDILNLFWFYKIVKGAYKLFVLQLHLHTD